MLALEATELRVVAQMSRGIDPGPAASLFKIRGTEIFQRITDLTHQAIGNYGLAIREHPVSANHFMPGPDYGHTASEKYLNSRKLSIYGGSNEIQRNIIAKAVLGPVTASHEGSDGYPVTEEQELLAIQRSAAAARPV